MLDSAYLTEEAKFLGGVYKDYMKDVDHFTAIAIQNGSDSQYIRALRKELKLKWYKIKLEKDREEMEARLEREEKAAKQDAIYQKKRWLEERREYWAALEKEKKREAEAEAERAERLKVLMSPERKKKLMSRFALRQPDFKSFPTVRPDDEEAYENHLTQFGAACEKMPSNNPMQLNYSL